ncbi:hypothetical protein DIPPA_16344 [Diplonema papillatum]|nr:hypothetical protein DIPPA_16344 [Diplonema papillatum]
MPVNTSAGGARPSPVACTARDLSQARGAVIGPARSSVKEWRNPARRASSTTAARPAKARSVAMRAALAMSDAASRLVHLLDTDARDGTRKVDLWQLIDVVRDTRLSGGNRRWKLACAKLAFRRRQHIARVGLALDIGVPAARVVYKWLAAAKSRILDRKAEAIGAELRSCAASHGFATEVDESSGAPSYLRQADPAMCEPAAIRARIMLQREPQVLAALQALWDSMPRCPHPHADKIDKQIYQYVVSASAADFITDRMECKKALSQVGTDWEAEAGGGFFMPAASFFPAFFAYLDVWARGVDVAEYCSLAAGVRRTLAAHADFAWSPQLCRQHWNAWVQAGNASGRETPEFPFPKRRSIGEKAGATQKQERRAETLEHRTLSHSPGKSPASLLDSNNDAFISNNNGARRIETAVVPSSSATALPSLRVAGEAERALSDKNEGRPEPADAEWVEKSVCSEDDGRAVRRLSDVSFTTAVGTGGATARQARSDAQRAADACPSPEFAFGDAGFSESFGSLAESPLHVGKSRRRGTAYLSSASRRRHSRPQPADLSSSDPDEEEEAFLPRPASERLLPTSAAGGSRGSVAGASAGKTRRRSSLCSGFSGRAALARKTTALFRRTDLRSSFAASALHGASGLLSLSRGAQAGLSAAEVAELRAARLLDEHFDTTAVGGGRQVSSRLRCAPPAAKCAWGAPVPAKGLDWENLALIDFSHSRLDTCGVVDFAGAVAERGGLPLLSAVKLDGNPGVGGDALPPLMRVVVRCPGLVLVRTGATAFEKDPRRVWCLHLALAAHAGRQLPRFRPNRPASRFDAAKSHNWRSAAASLIGEGPSITSEGADRSKKWVSFVEGALCRDAARAEHFAQNGLVDSSHASRQPVCSSVNRHFPTTRADGEFGLLLEELAGHFEAAGKAGSVQAPEEDAAVALQGMDSGSFAGLLVRSASCAGVARAVPCMKAALRSFAFSDECLLSFFDAAALLLLSPARSHP